VSRRCRAFYVVTASSYVLGVDVGTTSTAAAVHRAGRAVMFLLGSRGATIPSLAFLRDDQAILTGEAAERRGIVEPTRIARELKRRLGDSEPIVLGAAPFPAQRLLAALLEDVVATVTAREGGPPDHVAVTHPANWGPAKVDLLRHALDLAGLRSTTLVADPTAVAMHHAAQQPRPLAPGSTVAVHDLGGGTFDAVVVRWTGTACETLGEPQGIERLGGVDFDEAVFAHVCAELRGHLEDLDGDDPSVRVAIARLRRECAGAKEALATDAETTVPVALPNVHTDVRLTRTELERMVRPAIAETVSALVRAVDSAGLRPDDLAAVLLVGGSSRIPLVAQEVTSALGRAPAGDVHPKHAVALGAALVAAGASTSTTTTPVSTTSPTPSPPLSDPPAGGGGARGGPGRAAEAPALPGRVLPPAAVTGNGGVDIPP
jgi:molecular chaperone DnaK (HSP70)